MNSTLNDCKTLNLSLIVRLLRAEISETERMTFTSRFPKIHNQVCNKKLPPMKPTIKFFLIFQEQIVVPFSL